MKNGKDGRDFTLRLFQWKISCKDSFPYFLVFGNIRKKKKKRKKKEEEVKEKVFLVNKKSMTYF